MKQEQIREEARIYRKETSRSLTEYHKRMNKAAEEICLANPSMLRKRNEAACTHFIEEGFQFKKGKFRSKKSITLEPQPKLSQQVRERRRI